MLQLTSEQIRQALIRLGELALRRGVTVEIVVVGGAALALGYQARESTHDVDALILSPQAETVRAMARAVAVELGLAEDWLNDAAKGYVHGLSPLEELLTTPGIRVHMPSATQPSATQLLAMKLSAWRDDVDIADARLLLKHLRARNVSRQDIWREVEPYLVPGRELKASYAYEDLWETET